MHAIFCVALAVVLAPGDETPASKVAAAAAKAAEPTYNLRYQFKAGEKLRTKVVHLATMDTKIQGVSQVDKSRTVSTRVWDIKKVDATGNITLENSLEAVDMWQQSSGRQEVTYSSTSKEKPPAQYESVNKKIGKPLAMITIDQYGKVLERVDHFDKNAASAIGDLTITFPGKPIRIGQEWHVPQTIPVPTDNHFTQVKIRQCYELEKVETGIATIRVRTEILTPIKDAKLQSKLIQYMQEGWIKFDMDAGRIHSKQMDLDETVVGFAGNESRMTSVSRLTEEVVEGEATTAAKVGTGSTK